MDDLLTQAQREVDDLLPGTPKIAPARPFTPMPEPPPLNDVPDLRPSWRSLIPHVICCLVMLTWILASVISAASRLAVNERDLNLLHEQVFEARRQILRAEQDAEVARDVAAERDRDIDQMNIQLDERLRGKKGRRR